MLCLRGEVSVAGGNQGLCGVITHLGDPWMETALGNPS